MDNLNPKCLFIKEFETFIEVKRVSDMPKTLQNQKKND